MEVILLEPLRKLGNVGDVVRVKNGFARNFLIPNNKALRANKDNIAYFEAKKSEIEKDNKKKVEAAEAVAKKIDKTVVSLIQQAGEDGRLYGSVNATSIAKAVVEQTKQEIDRKQIILNETIKYIGVQDVEIDIYADVTATIHVNVARTESEAKDAAAKFAKGERVSEDPRYLEKDKAPEQKATEVKEDAKKDEKAEEGKAEAKEEKAEDKKEAEKKPAAKKAEAKGEEKEEPKAKKETKATKDAEEKADKK